jgi:hypothetical protein
VSVAIFPVLAVDFASPLRSDIGPERLDATASDAVPGARNQVPTCSGDLDRRAQGLLWPSRHRVARRCGALASLASGSSEIDVDDGPVAGTLASGQRSDPREHRWCARLPSPPGPSRCCGDLAQKPRRE